MLRTKVFLLLVVVSVVSSQLIIDESTEWGRKLIAKMMTAINVHEEYKHEHLEFVKVVNTLGTEKHCTAYLACKNNVGKQFSCTCELLEHEEYEYEIGLVICSNDQDKTTVAL